MVSSCLFCNNMAVLCYCWNDFCSCSVLGFVIFRTLTLAISLTLGVSLGHLSGFCVAKLLTRLWKRLWCLDCFAIMLQPLGFCYC